MSDRISEDIYHLEYILLLQAKRVKLSEAKILTPRLELDVARLSRRTGWHHQAIPLLIPLGYTLCQHDSAFSK